MADGNRGEAVPLFEYRCKKCDVIEEVLAKHSDPPPKVCEACGHKGKMDKVVSITSFQLKGGGWYKDLYSSVPKDGGSSSDSSSSDSSSSSDAKSDTKSKDSKKSDAKSESKAKSSGSSSTSESKSKGAAKKSKKAKAS